MQAHAASRAHSCKPALLAQALRRGTARPCSTCPCRAGISCFLRLCPPAQQVSTSVRTRHAVGNAPGVGPVVLLRLCSRPAAPGEFIRLSIERQTKRSDQPTWRKLHLVPPLLSAAATTPSLTDPQAELQRPEDACSWHNVDTTEGLTSWEFQLRVDEARQWDGWGWAGAVPCCCMPRVPLPPARELDRMQHATTAFSACWPCRTATPRCRGRSGRRMWSAASRRWSAACPPCGWTGEPWHARLAAWLPLGWGCMPCGP